ncbi:DHA2 family efflux MFS transporter permease subunit [Pseudofrankia sp. BMG5.36]|uniref:DHA2 family efflux MFS transporter permease subunit n=1 Tax=Pseudofrankia sp. BMG5.36 TaxID=1834512 RepID=UPI0009F4D11D|nr:DHA2 family efflux MFS transporter permease subunit [Pseudofrankia sp. BMG5.36]
MTTIHAPSRTHPSRPSAPATPASLGARPASAPGPFRRRWATLAVLCLSLLVIVVDTTIVNVALPTLSRDLHPTASGLAWIVDAYTLAFAALLLPAGALGDRYGRHRALAAGLIVFGAGSLGAALTTTTAQLIALRALMGAGAAFVMPATLSILTSVFTDPAERVKAIGLWSGVSGLGVAIGPTAGGWLLAHFSWGSIFLVNLPVVAVALTAGALLVPASRAPRPVRPDLAGALLSIAGLGTLTYTLIQAPAAGWTSTTTLARAAAAAALLAAFTGWQLHSDHPMVDVTVFRNPRFTAASAAIMTMFFALTGATFLLTQIYQFVLGYSPLGAGVRALPSALALAIASQFGAHLATRLGTRATVAGGLLVMAGGLAFFATATTASTYPHYLIATVVMSTGLGLAMAPATTSIMNALPPAKTGVGSAINDTTRNLGSVLGIAILGSIATTAYTHTLTHQLPAATAPTAGQSIGAATAIAHHTPGPAGQAIAHTTASAFIHGTNLALTAATATLLAAAAIALRYLPARTAAAPQLQTEPEPAA